MPEGAEIMQFADLFNKYKNQKCQIILKGKWLNSLLAEKINLLNFFIEASNHGKLLILDFGLKLLVHCGLDGYFSENPEKNTIEFCFEKGNVYFTENINLAKFSISEEADIKKLGFDCCHPKEGDFDIFYKSLKKHKTHVYKVIKKQSVCSGCGNYLRAEAIKHAKLPPLITCANITQEQALNLFNALIFITKERYHERWNFKVYGIGKKIKDGNTYFWF